MPSSPSRPEVTLAPSPRGTDLVHAERFGVPLAAARDPATWPLVRGPLGMALHTPAPPGLTLELDLGRGPLARRLHQCRPTDALPRACGLQHATAPPFVLDATAGLGRDAMVLAYLGCRVVAIERVPALAFLTHAAVEGSSLARSLQIVAGDARDWLQQATPADQPEVVYLDPMFERQGEAQVKKDMQVCRLLAAADDPTEVSALLTLARAVATHRVVVKRHRELPPVAADVAFAVAGERVRFDVYLRPR